MLPDPKGQESYENPLRISKTFSLNHRLVSDIQVSKPAQALDLGHPQSNPPCTAQSSIWISTHSHWLVDGLQRRTPSHNAVFCTEAQVTRLCVSAAVEVLYPVRCNYVILVFCRVQPVAVLSWKAKESRIRNSTPPLKGSHDPLFPFVILVRALL